MLMGTHINTVLKHKDRMDFFAAYCIKHAYIACMLASHLNWAPQKIINGFMTYLGHCSMANGYSE